MGILRDYIIHGHALEGMNLFNFILKTYEVRITRAGNVNHGAIIPYLPISHKPDRACMLRPSVQEMLSEIIGE